MSVMPTVHTTQPNQSYTAQAQGEFVTINEAVSVAGVYNEKGFTPTKFRWHDRIFKIEEITLITRTKDGGIHKKLYSILSNNTLYRLEFNQYAERWHLLEVWSE